MNLLQQGAAWLGSQVKAAAGVPVTYARGDTELEIVGVPAQQQYEMVDQKAGLLTSVVICDWTFIAGDLPLTPQQGDLITADAGTFEVLPLDAKPCFEWLDASGLLVTVHTKRIS